ncbi:aminoacyltransferase [Staphylococcus agnetis]|uniref:aminoacyltransferase n=1 Tax=Staphylococcus agnetis TaxID=985762 RepID=UPI0021D2842B|nr:aminoacyltransferase [Staphylococcus agnetis]UXU64527.1 aminoacyltransferase [Staphylococcus agnetis]UXU66867.1 aminoacyltransferase [Staphylococcus agnetis]
MQFVTLTSEEFETFAQAHFSHYTQSVSHYLFRERQGVAHLVGVKDDQQNIIAACLLTEARCLKFFKYFYTQRGPIMDFNNLTLVQFFYHHLTTYLKKQRCLYVLTDPYWLENIRDAKGNIIKSYDNQALIQVMHKLGYEHQGYPVGYSTSSQIRWLSVLDLKDKSIDALLKEMGYQTRRNIKKTYEMGVEVMTLPYEETERFFKLFRMAEEKHGFKFRDLAYFEQLQDIYGERIMLKLAYIDLNKLLTAYKDRLDELNQQLTEVEAVLAENSNSKKTKNKYQQLQQQVASQQKKIKETQARIASDGEVLDLAAAVYIYNDHEVYYLSSGSNPKYNAYMGAYRLQWEMIQFAKNYGIDRYNFYGITGDFTDDAEDYGVQRFKEGFNAHVEEFIGDFVKPIMPLCYRLYQLINRS